MAHADGQKVGEEAAIRAARAVFANLGSAMKLPPIFVDICEGEVRAEMKREREEAATTATVVEVAPEALPS